jgi:hypothetical protein
LAPWLKKEKGTGAELKQKKISNNAAELKACDEKVLLAATQQR